MNYAINGLTINRTLKETIENLETNLKYYFDISDAIYAICKGSEIRDNYDSAPDDSLYISNYYNFIKNDYSETSVDCIGTIRDINNLIANGFNYNTIDGTDSVLGCYIFGSRTRLNGRFRYLSKFIRSDVLNKQICIIVMDHLRD